MTAPLEPYRVILDYEALEDMFLDRIEDLNIPFSTVDENGGFTQGEAQKLLCKSRERWARTFGVISLGKMLKGTGIALVAVVDDERFAEVKANMKLRRRAKTPPNAGSARPAWLFTKKKAREMGKKRFSLMTDAERKRHQRKAGKASAKSRRRKARQAVQLAAVHAPVSPRHGLKLDRVDGVEAISRAGQSVGVSKRKAQSFADV